MSCSCGSNHSDPIACYQQLVGGVLTGLQASGVLFYAFHKVELLYETRINARPFAGDPGQPIQRKVLMTPGPMVDMNVKLYQPDGTIIEKTGYAKIKRILARDSANGLGYTEADFTGAASILIDGCPWDLVEGSIIRPANGIFWELLVQKTKV